MKNLTAAAMSLVFLLTTGAHSLPLEVLPQNDKRADDALIPDTTGFAGISPSAPDDDYARIVLSAFADAYSPKVQARILVLNAFMGYESATGIVKDGDTYRIFSMQSTDWLWQYTAVGVQQAIDLQHPLKSTDYRTVKIKRCSHPIDRDLAERIVGIWQLMLAQAHEQQADGNVSYDEADVHFAALKDGKVVAGTEYREGPKIRELDGIASQMEELCWHKNLSDLHGLEKRTLPFLLQLKAN
jgi:hypothetical protein